MPALLYKRRAYGSIIRYTALGPWKEHALVKDFLEEVRLARQRLAAAEPPAAWVSEAK